MWLLVCIRQQVVVLFLLRCCFQCVAVFNMLLDPIWCSCNTLQLLGLHIRALAEPYSCMCPLALLLHAIADTLCVAAAATCCCNIHGCILQLQHCRCWCEVLLHDE